MTNHNSKPREKKNKKGSTSNARKLPVKIWIGIGIFTAIIVASGLWISMSTPKVSQNRPLSLATSVSIGGSLDNLVNQDGKVVMDKDFLGKYRLVYFGFTNCPSECPIGLQTMASALEIVGYNSPKIQPIFITVDSARDTPDVLRTYVKNFSPRLIGLTGERKQLKQVKEEYKVYAAKVEDEKMSSYVMNHSSFIYLMGPDGKYITMFQHTIAPKDLAAQLRSYVTTTKGSL